MIEEYGAGLRGLGREEVGNLVENREIERGFGGIIKIRNFNRGLLWIYNN